MQTVEPLNTIPLQLFIQQVKSAESSQSREIKIDIATAKNLAFTLGIVMSRLEGDLEKLVSQSSQSDEKIEINVLDNGPGIPKAQREKLLEPFERLDQARGSIGGSGLGLAIANRIVLVHNGKMELINRRTGGLNVKLTFPLIKAN